MLVVSEDDGSIDVCAVLRGKLDRQVSLVLTIAANTAGSGDISSGLFMHNPTSGSGVGSGSGLGSISGLGSGLDWSGSGLESGLAGRGLGSGIQYTFASGSESGSTVCNAIGIIRDGLVENTELFTVFLQGDPEDDAVNITNEETVIFITDSSLDCMFGLVLVVHLLY